MTEPVLPRFIQALLSPRAYPHPVDRVDLVQTHISYVLLAGDYVYKVKKPLDLGFLDYSTLEKRRFYCEEEVRLNARFCPRTYFGVSAIVEGTDGVSIDGRGEVVEYAVRMRRLPADRVMADLLGRDEVTPAMVRSLGRRLAGFHASAETNDRIAGFGRVETVAANWRENFEQTAPFIGRTVSEAQFEAVRAYVERFIDANRDLIERRAHEGRARDCHGDLRADAVVFEDDGVCVFDCIEFNDRIRFSDVASDLAFLAMDLDFRGYAGLADELVGAYVDAALDSTLPLVFNFYRCYRAYVRGKVDGFQIDEPEVPEAQREEARRRARAYFRLAEAYARQAAPPVVIAMSGLTGSGKTYLGDALAGRLGTFVSWSDVVRKRLAGMDPAAPARVPFESGIYSPEMTERTYRALVAEARPFVQRRQPVILDATFLRARHRALARDLAQEAGAQFLLVECRVPDAVARDRLAARGEVPAVSDGRLEIYEAQQAAYEPPDELPPDERLTLDTSGPLPELIAAVMARVGVPYPPAP